MTSQSFTVIAAQPSTLTIVSGNKQTTRRGTAFPAPLIVELRDAFGNVVPDVQIIFSALNGTNNASGTFPGGSNVARINTDAAGRASTTITANANAGQFSVTAESGAAGPTPVSVTLTNS